MPTSLASGRRAVPGRDPQGAEDAAPEDAEPARRSPRPQQSPRRQESARQLARDDSILDGIHATPSMRLGKKKALVSRLRGFEVLRWTSRRVREDCYLEFKLVSNPTKGHAVPALLQGDCAWRDDDNRPISKALGVLSVNYNFRDVGTVMIAKVALSKRRVEWYHEHFIHDSTFVTAQDIPPEGVPLTPAFSVFGRDVRVEIADITQWFKADSKTPLMGPLSQPVGWWAADEHCPPAAGYALKPIPSMRPGRRSRSHPVLGGGGFAPPIMRSESTPTLWDTCFERLGRPHYPPHRSQLMKSAEFAARGGTRTPSPLLRHPVLDRAASASASSFEKRERSHDTVPMGSPTPSGLTHTHTLPVLFSKEKEKETFAIPPATVDTSAASASDPLDSTVRSADARARPLVPTLSLLALHGNDANAAAAAAAARQQQEALLTGGSNGSRGRYDLPYVVSEICTSRSGKPSTLADDVSSTTAPSSPPKTARPPTPERASVETEGLAVTISSFGNTIKDPLNAGFPGLPEALLPEADMAVPTAHRIKLLGGDRDEMGPPGGDALSISAPRMPSPPDVEQSACEKAADAHDALDETGPEPSPEAGLEVTAEGHADERPAPTDSSRSMEAEVLSAPLSARTQGEGGDKNTHLDMLRSIAEAMTPPASARRATPASPAATHRHEPKEWRRSPRVGTPRTPTATRKQRGGGQDDAAVPQHVSELGGRGTQPPQAPVAAASEEPSHGVPVSRSFILAKKAGRTATQTPPAAARAPTSPALTGARRVGSAVALTRAASTREGGGLRRAHTATPPRRAKDPADPPRSAKKGGSFWSFLERQDAYAKQKAAEEQGKGGGRVRTRTPQALGTKRPGVGKMCEVSSSEQRSKTCATSQSAHVTQQDVHCVQQSEVVRETVTVVRQGNAPAPAFVEPSPSFGMLSPSVDRLDLWSPSQALAPSFNFAPTFDAPSSPGVKEITPAAVVAESPDVASPDSLTQVWSPPASLPNTSSFHNAPVCITPAALTPLARGARRADAVAPQELAGRPHGSNGSSASDPAAAAAALRASVAEADLEALRDELAAVRMERAEQGVRVGVLENLVEDLCSALQGAVSETQALLQHPTFELMNHHLTLTAALGNAASRLPAPLAASVGDSLRATLAGAERLATSLSLSSDTDRPETTSRALFDTPAEDPRVAELERALTLERERVQALEAELTAFQEQTAASTAAATQTTPLRDGESSHEALKYIDSARSCDLSLSCSDWAGSDDVASLREKLGREQARRVAALKEAGMKDVQIKELSAKVDMLEAVNVQVQADKEEQRRGYVESLDSARGMANSSFHSSCANDADAAKLLLRAEEAEAQLAESEAIIQDLHSKMHEAQLHPPKPRSPLCLFHPANKTRTSSSASLAYSAATAAEPAPDAVATLQRALDQRIAAPGNHEPDGQRQIGAPPRDSAMSVSCASSLPGYGPSPWKQCDVTFTTAEAEAEHKDALAAAEAAAAEQAAELEEVQTESAAQAEKIAGLVAEVAALEAARADLVADAEGTTQRAVRAERKLAAAEAQIMEKLEEIVAVQELVQDIRERMTHDQRRVAELEAELQAQQPPLRRAGSVASAVSDTVDHAEDVDSLRAVLAEQQEQAAAAEQEARRAAARNATLDAECQELHAEVATLHGRVAELEAAAAAPLETTALDRVQQENEVLGAECASLHADCAALRQQLQQQTLALRRMSACDESRRRTDDLERELATVEEEGVTLRGRLAEQATALDAAQQRYELSQRMHDKYDAAAQENDALAARCAALEAEKAALEMGLAQAACTAAQEAPSEDAAYRVLRAESFTLRKQLDEQTDQLYESRTALEASTAARAETERSLQERMVGMQKELEAAQARCATARQQADQLRAQLQQQQLKIAETTARHGQASQEITELHEALAKTKTQAAVHERLLRDGLTNVAGALETAMAAEVAGAETAKRLLLLEVESSALKAAKAAAEAAAREATEQHMMHDLRAGERAAAARQASEQRAADAEAKASLEKEVHLLEQACIGLQQQVQDASKKVAETAEANAALTEALEEHKLAKVEAKALREKAADLEAQIRQQKKMKKVLEKDALFLTPEKQAVQQRSQEQLVADLRRQVKELKEHRVHQVEAPAAPPGAAGDELDAMAARCAELEAALAEKAAELAAATDRLKSAGERKADKKSPATCHLLAEVRDLKGKLAAAADAHVALEAQLAAADARIAVLTRERDAAAEQAATVQGQLRLLTGVGGKAVDLAASEARRAELETQLEDERAALRQLRADGAAADDKADGQAKEIARLRVAAGEHEAERAALAARIDELRGDLRSHAEAYGALEARLAAQEAMRAGLQKELGSRCEEVATAEAQVAALKSKLANVTHEHQSMQKYAREKHAELVGSLSLSTLKQDASSGSPPASGRATPRSQRPAQVAVAEAERLLQEYEALHDEASTASSAASSQPPSVNHTPRGEGPASARRRFF